MRILRLLASTFLVALVAFLGQAQTCIPPATGIPFNPTPPHWWDSTGQPPYNSTVDDPRWVHSASVTYGDGTKTLADFRTFHGDGKTQLYLSWRAFIPPHSTAAKNFLFIGLDRVATGPIIIQLSLPSLATASASTPTFKIRKLKSDGTLESASPFPDLPSIITTAKYWTTPTTFAFEVRVDLSEIVVSANTHKIWYELIAGLPPGDSVTAFSWPRGSTVFLDNNLGENVFPLPATWDTFTLSNVGCTGSGVSIDANHIGTHNTPSSRIEFSASVTKSNLFFAQAKNDTGAIIPKDQLLAKFSRATWGSVPSNALAPWTPIPGGGAVKNLNDIPDGTTATTANENQFTWAISPAEAAPFLNGSQSKHQCMLVELSSTTPLTFTNSSALRNMDFVATSTFERIGRVGIDELTPFSPNGRTVCMQMDVLNMPERVAPGTSISSGKGEDGHNHGYEQLTPAQLQEAAASGRITEAEMDGLIPTYRIHVFHDSGKKILIDGIAVPLFDPQGGFGYRAIHQGEVLGWAHKTICEDCTLEERVPNFYCTRNVPNDGAVHVRTTIEAIEPGQSGQGPYRFFFDLGPNLPGDGFASFVEGQWSANVGVEKLIRPNLSVEAIAGYHLFEAEAEGRFESCLHIEQFSANLKYYLGAGPLHWFVNGGGGVYHLDAPDTWKWGVNGGTGLLYDVNSRWGVGGVYTYHRVNSSPDLSWSTLQADVRIRF